jgi:hypothetical protein
LRRSLTCKISLNDPQAPHRLSFVLCRGSHFGPKKQLPTEARKHSSRSYPAEERREFVDRVTHTQFGEILRHTSRPSATRFIEPSRISFRDRDTESWNSDETDQITGGLSDASHHFLGNPAHFTRPPSLPKDELGPWVSGNFRETRVWLTRDSLYRLDIQTV